MSAAVDVREPDRTPCWLRAIARRGWVLASGLLPVLALVHGRYGLDVLGDPLLWSRNWIVPMGTLALAMGAQPVFPRWWTAAITWIACALLYPLAVVVDAAGC
jgi:hypothetical protein